MRKKMMIRMIALIVVSLALVGALRAEDGVHADEIVLGQSCALHGPAKALGRAMNAGLSAYFAKVNARGGLQGRQVRLIERDDGYEPRQAIRNTRSLIEEEKVFLLIGEVGTPTSKAVVPIAEACKVPFFAPFTGAEFLRKPLKKYVINVRGSYYNEMEKITQYLVNHLGKRRIACFYQNDGYGQAGLKGLEMALQKRFIQLSATATYERNTVAVKSGLLKIRKANPEAVVLVGAYKPCAEFIKLAKKIGMKDTVFCNISFVGTEALRNELGDRGEGCIISQVVHFPWNDRVPLINEYMEDMKTFQPDARIGFVSLEGYMAAKLFCLAVESVEGPLTRESFLEAIEKTGSFDLGEVLLTFGPDDHQGMNEVFLTAIENGQIVPINYP